MKVKILFSHERFGADGVVCRVTISLLLHLTLDKLIVTRQSSEIQCSSDDLVVLCHDVRDIERDQGGAGRGGASASEMRVDQPDNRTSVKVGNRGTSLHRFCQSIKIPCNF